MAAASTGDNMRAARISTFRRSVRRFIPRGTPRRQRQRKAPDTRQKHNTFHVFPSIFLLLI
jgi:hypothetical protein